MSVFAVATATHFDINKLLLMNLDPTTVRFGQVDENVMAAAIVPIESKVPTCRVGKSHHTLPQQMKIMAVANHEGAVGHMLPSRTKM